MSRVASQTSQARSTPRRRYRPKNPLICTWCFRKIGASRHGVIGWHKYQGRKCPGIGTYGQVP